MLIDWLTLRFPLTLDLGRNLLDRIQSCLGLVVCVDSDGKEKWRRNQLDIEKLRSDTQGLMWCITGDGDGQRYLTIGGSPSSIENDGLNVFGSCDVEHCATILIQHASRALNSILPAWYRWQCRRLDITANYDLGNSAQVKQALRLLLGTDAPRRRTNSDKRGGDSVYWNIGSDLKAGKAYHKGAQLRVLASRGDILVDDETLELADSLLRLELKLGARFFRRYEISDDWTTMTEYELTTLHRDYFSALIGEGKEVYDMGTLLASLENVCPTKGRALAAHRTWALIKTVGFDQTKCSMPLRTFQRHLSYLRDAGLSDADLCAGQVLPFRRQQLILAEPVTSWIQIRRAA